jgi:hypothetical protein
MGTSTAARRSVGKRSRKSSGSSGVPWARARQALAQPGGLQALGRQRGFAGDRVDGQALGIEMQFCQKASPEKKKASVWMPFSSY